MRSPCRTKELQLTDCQAKHCRAKREPQPDFLPLGDRRRCAAQPVCFAGRGHFVDTSRRLEIRSKRDGRLLDSARLRFAEGLAKGTRIRCAAVLGLRHERGKGVHFLCGLTFELRGRQRRDARPGLAKMYRVPPDRAWWPAVSAPLERGVRRRWGGAGQARPDQSVTLPPGIRTP